MIVVGCDPGQSGGFAAVSAETGNLIDAIEMPLTQVRKKPTLDVHAAGDWLERIDADFGVIEAVNAMPRQGVSSSFQFGRMFGGAEAMVLNWTRSQDYVTPVVWKQKMGLSPNKNASRDLATRLFGRDRAMEHWKLARQEGVAEAALIALYYIRHVLGRK